MSALFLQLQYLDCTKTQQEKTGHSLWPVVENEYCALCCDFPWVLALKSFFGEGMHEEARARCGVTSSINPCLTALRRLSMNEDHCVCEAGYRWALRTHLSPPTTVRLQICAAVSRSVGTWELRLSCLQTKCSYPLSRLPISLTSLPILSVWEGGKEREKGKEADLCKESYFFKGSFKFKEFESRSRMNLALIKSVFYKPYKARRLWIQIQKSSTKY